ncbi:MAG TPA: substrate-binding domain-containing protein [Rectinemataceae bacterium]|nr:substrate-binding domain-containing protein [Rectinemataceae bacterium]
MKKAAFVLLIAGATLAGACRSAVAPKPALGVALSANPDLPRFKAALVRAAAGKAQLSILYAGSRQTVQNAQIDGLLERKPKALAVDLILGEAASLVIDKAKAAIVPLVLFGTQAGAEDMKRWDKVYYVGAKLGQAAALEGGALAAWWKEHPASNRGRDGKILYVYLGGTESEAAACGKGIADSGEGAQLLGRAEVSGRDAGEREMGAFLATYGRRLGAVACADDETALGAIAALRAKGYLSGKRTLPVVGVGATPEALAAIKDGQLVGSAWEDIEGQAKAVFDLSMALASGTELSRTGWPMTEGKYVWVPYRMVTAKNLADYRN